MRADLPVHRRLPAALLCVTVLLAACGTSSSGAATPTSPKAEGHRHTPGMRMNGGASGGEALTDAREVADATLLTGAFALLDTRPPGTDGAGGTAWLAHGDAGTTVTIELVGLPADSGYMAHVHAQPCSVDNGGPHFQFEVGGATTPPNELHLAFSSAADGAGAVTVADPKDTGDRAKSVVVHPVEAMDSRIACADLA
jgi:hypothetical protein